MNLYYLEKFLFIAAALFAFLHNWPRAPSRHPADAVAVILIGDATSGYALVEEL